MGLKRGKLTEAAGWIGVVLILAAYALLATHVFSGTDWQYHVLNGLGAIGVVVDAAAQKNWQPAVLNAIWFGLAIVGIITGLVV
jgi:hypothetical protein